jgi:hypothetical protein
MIRFSPLDALRANASAGLAWAHWLQSREGSGIASSVATVYPNAQVFGSMTANCVGAGHIDEPKVVGAELIKLDPTFSTQRALIELFPLRKVEFRSKLEAALRTAGLPE